MPLLCGSTVYLLAAVNKVSNGIAEARRAQLGYMRREFIIEQFDDAKTSPWVRVTFRKRQ